MNALAKAGPAPAKKTVRKIRNDEPMGTTKESGLCLVHQTGRLPLPSAWRLDREALCKGEGEWSADDLRDRFSRTSTEVVGGIAALAAGGLCRKNLIVALTRKRTGKPAWSQRTAI